MTIETNKSLFDEQLKNPCIVDFYTSGCPHCEKLAPVFEELSEHHDHLTFLKVNLDEDITLAERYGIHHVPTLIHFIDGKPISINSGYLDKDNLSAFITDGKDDGI